MEAIFALAFSCAVAALPFAVVGGMFAWQVSQHRRESRRWLEAAPQLGLVPEPYDAARHRELVFFDAQPSFRQVMHGERGGVPVSVGIRVVITGSGKSRRKTYYTYAEAALPAPLGVGLSAYALSSARGFFQALAGSSDLRVGHADVDRLYDIQAVDGRAAAQILTAPYVSEALVGLAGQSFRPHLSDTAVRCEAVGRVTDVRRLAFALDCAVDLAHRVASARSGITTDLEHALSTTWRDVASTLGLELDPREACMRGRVAGVAVEAVIRTSPDGRSTVFTAQFDRRLGVDLALTRQGSLTDLATFFGAQDIQVGDALFDARFVVKGRPIDRVRALLTADVRAHLVAIQDQVSELTVRDDRLVARVGWMVVEPRWVEGGLLAVARAAAALSNVQTPSVGPFRS